MLLRALRIVFVVFLVVSAFDSYGNEWQNDSVGVDLSKNLIRAQSAYIRIPGSYIVVLNTDGIGALIDSYCF